MTLINYVLNVIIQVYAYNATINLLSTQTDNVLDAQEMQAVLNVIKAAVSGVQVGTLWIRMNRDVNLAKILCTTVLNVIRPLIASIALIMLLLYSLVTANAIPTRTGLKCQTRMTRDIANVTIMPLEIQMNARHASRYSQDVRDVLRLTHSWMLNTDWVIQHTIPSKWNMLDALIVVLISTLVWVN